MEQVDENDAIFTYCQGDTSCCIHLQQHTGLVMKFCAQITSPRRAFLSKMERAIHRLPQDF